MATWRDVLEQSLQELGVVAAGETMSAADSSFMLAKSHRLLDNWNAEKAAVYAEQLATYTLTPNLQPHTIGPTGTFVVTQRPIEILSANLISDDVRIPLRVLQGIGAWASYTDKEGESDYPYDLVYEPTWANGSIYFVPEADAAKTLELHTRLVLSAPALADTFTLPPGYRDAVTLTLAEDAADAYGIAISPKLAAGAAKARGRIFGLNDRKPDLSTIDVGMPGTAGSWDWRTGNLEVRR